MNEATFKINMAAPMRRKLTNVCLNKQRFNRHFSAIEHQNRPRTYCCISRYHCSSCILVNNARTSQKQSQHISRKITPLNSTATTSFFTPRTYSTDSSDRNTFRQKINTGPSLGDFINASSVSDVQQNSLPEAEHSDDPIPYLKLDVSKGNDRKGIFWQNVLRLDNKIVDYDTIPERLSGWSYVCVRCGLTLLLVCNDTYKLIIILVIH